MKQREDDRTGELAGLDQPPIGTQTGKARLEPPLTYRRDPAFKRILWGRGRQVGMRVGPYRDGRHYASRRARLRIGTGRTQAEFAALVGCSERTIRNWEHGQAIPSYGVSQRIRKALADCGVSDLEALALAFG